MVHLSDAMQRGETGVLVLRRGFTQKGKGGGGEGRRVWASEAHLDVGACMHACIRDERIFGLLTGAT